MLAHQLFTISPHLFIQQFTPPVPLGLCLIAAGLVVLASFGLVGIFARNEHRDIRYPQFNLATSKLTIPICLATFVLQIISVFIFFLIICAGIFGNANPVYNIAPTMVWVIWWVGVAYISAFVGDIWSILNPWKIIFEWVEKLVHFLRLSLPVGVLAKYPRSFGIWPALTLLVIFAWIENVYPDAITPLRISQMILIYSGITWVGMIIYGKNIWLRNGEAFSLVFGLFAKFAPIRIRSFGIHSIDMAKEPVRLNHATDNLNVSHGSEIIVRPFGAGLLNLRSASTTHMYFVLVLLASVTFDGFTATVQWMNIQTILYDYIASETLINSFGLLLAVMIFIATYLSFCFLVQRVSGTTLTTVGIANRFIYTLIPIALAYHVAHFLVFLLVQGQLIIPLISDPFGFGWDIWGSENYRLNFNIVPPTFYWATSVIAIVVGHIIAVFVAHSIALRTEETPREAIQSQFPMLALMVGYTVASLWIITQPMYMPNM